jgi:Ca2+-binding EF-hand superfamily protein
MSAARTAIVDQAWSVVSNGKDSVSFDELTNKFNSKQHPRVVSREKKADTVMADFHNCMQVYVKAGSINKQGFNEYYMDLNAVMPAEKETYFVDLLVKTWTIPAKVVQASGKRVSQLEDMLFEKIRQRTHGADDEGRTARKYFSHFDLEGYGTIRFPEFVKSLEAVGCVMTQSDAQSLFQKFDKNGDGKVDYEEFAAYFALKGSGNNPNVNPSFGITREPPNQVITKILDVLKIRGMHGIRGMGRVFRRMDNNGDRRLDRQEFMWGLKENGHTLSPSEFERIFKFFDKNNSGKIDYDEFLRAVRGTLNARRADLVN